MFNRILMICVGNICRSPTAEYLLRSKLSRRHSRESGNPLSVVIESAGIGALVDKPMDATALAILEEQGIDGRSHRARQVTEDMLASADLILAMENKHLSHLHNMAPQVRGRSFVLGKWIADQEIPDPYRQQRPAFDHAFRLIDEATSAWLRYIC